MTTVNQRIDHEMDVKALFENRIKAISVRDIDELISGYSLDVVAFDVVDPLQYSGSDGVRRRMQEWFGSFNGPIGIENHELTIAACDDVAFCHSLSHVNGTMTDGEHLEMWWRETVCYRKIEGTWLITHQHSSVPFNVASGKASLDLQP